MNSFHPFAPSSLRSAEGGNCRKCGEAESAHGAAADATRMLKASLNLRDFGAELEKLKARGAAARVELEIADADGDGDQDVTLKIDGVTVGTLELGTIVEGIRRLFSKVAKSVKRAVKRATKGKGRSK